MGSRGEDTWFSLLIFFNFYFILFLCVCDSDRLCLVLGVLGYVDTSMGEIDKCADQMMRFDYKTSVGKNCVK